MKHYLAIVVLMLAIGGCAHRGPPPCVPGLFPLEDDEAVPQSKLTYLNYPPLEAAALLDLIQPEDLSPYPQGRIRKVWFRAETGVLVYNIGTEVVGFWIGFVNSEGGWRKLKSDRMFACIN